MANPHETPVAEMNTQTPEERFRELVLIRETEKRIEEKLEVAQSEVDSKIKAVQAEISQMRDKVEADTAREIQTLHQKAVQEAEAEARQLIDEAEQIASGTESKAGGNVQNLIDQFKEELLSK